MEQKKEAVYLINDERYLHLRENGAGVGFATYNKVTGEPLESGQISEKNLPPDGRNAISAARNWYLFELSDDDRKVIQQESVQILENIPQAGIGRRRIWEPETLPKDIRLIEEMQERIDAATARYHELGDSIKATETRMAEIAVLRTHIVNYARTRPVYDAYRKAGYSKRFLDTHREEITLHKAAKTAFDEAGLKKLPKAKDLSIEYAELLKKKKESYPDYRKARDEMQELMKAQKNVEMFFAEEKSTTEKGQAR